MSSNSTRFTNLDEDAVSELPTPLLGYENDPFESLEKSIEPIQHLFNGIGANVFVAKESSFNSGPSLYKVLNQTLRSEDRQNVKPWFKYLKLFLTGLEKLPSHRRTVWRGIRDVDISVQYPKGKKGAWWGISSCTSDLDVLQSAQFLGQTVLYRLNYPNPCGAMAGSSDDHQYLLAANQNPSVSLILFHGNQLISTTPINEIITDIFWSKSREIFLVA